MNRPILPEDRPCDYYNIDDEIVVYMDLTPEEGDPPREDGLSEADNGWYTAQVRSGYRHHDGCVSYRMDGIGPQDPVSDEWDPNFKGYWGAGYSWHGVLKKEEFEYFATHPQEYVDWFNTIESNRSYGKPLKFYSISDNDIAMMAKNLLKS